MKSSFEAIDDGQTPLDRDEATGLRQDWITTRADLNLAEEENIRTGIAWAQRTGKRGNVLTQTFLREPHARLFGLVWDWAGSYRHTERNIGVAPHAISSDLQNLFDDALAWKASGTYEIDDRAARLHHRLTWIHPFPNGNGRCARVFADTYLRAAGVNAFSWGTEHNGRAREKYLAALRRADAHDYAPLLAFVRN
ncbi:MAG: mobile mystery protein B [Dokdonella sp.]